VGRGRGGQGEIAAQRRWWNEEVRVCGFRAHRCGPTHLVTNISVVVEAALLVLIAACLLIVVVAVIVATPRVRVVRVERSLAQSTVQKGGECAITQQMRKAKNTKNVARGWCQVEWEESV
jgi:hypothetical protein